MDQDEPPALRQPTNSKCDDGLSLLELWEPIAVALYSGQSVGLSVEAPLRSPRRAELSKIAGTRGGVEALQNRAWSAGAGFGGRNAYLPAGGEIDRGTE